MGGKAIKNTPVRRFARAEYLELEASVLAQLRQDFAGRRVEAIQAYRAKPDFGDMDVLLESDNLTLDIPQYLRDTFGAKEVAPNGSVISFEHKEFQVDLILTPERHFQTSYNYFAWNDLGNLLGRVVHAHGRAKLGHQGLTFPFKNGDYMFEELEVERDWSVILPAFGFDYERWKQGFETTEDIFRFVVSSPYFNRDIYLLHNRNYKSRVRDAKRKTYSDFLEWLEVQPEGSLPAFPYPEDRYEMLPRLFDAVPGFKEKYEAVRQRFDDHVRFQERFNGEYVGKLTGRTDAALGRLMKHLREQFPEKGGQRDFVLQQSDAELADWVLQAHRTLSEPVA
jgi:hypothetical protein